MNLVPWVLSKQPSTSIVLLPLEPDFSNMSDPSVVIELLGNNWRSDNNNNDNYRQIRSLHPPLQLPHLQTLARESQKDLNIPTRREEGDIHLLLLPQCHIIKYMIMADTREVHRLYKTRKFYSLRKYLMSRQ